MGNQQPAGQQWRPVPSQNSQYGTASGQPPVVPQQGESGGTSGLGKGPIVAIVGCGLLVLVLLLSLVGFFGVRVLMGDGDDEQSTTSQEESPAEEGSTEPEEATQPEETTAQAEEETTTPEQSPEPTEEAAPAGEANAVPQGTVITLAELSDYEGSVDVAIGDVNWDATEWVNEQNSHNPQPTDQGKYIMVQAEITYHGPDTFNSFAFVPLDYVAADGTPYEDAGVVTPDTLNKLNLTDGQSGTLHFVFMTPADVPEGGHFVVSDGITQQEALVEGQWIAAA